ncbi:hypothetical protein V2H45_07820 [Tumidithrix elongata RA019]|uniref:P pilus assembly/Cpx signaling pathway, periplasmic inhibitor/zinc-resistance associated protein n=1 Tax=Tumidithrix elongata BACA0141 TaxID=2716417 RepID=A0AAW9Q0C3_9CYAN|nr:hypothetical protein [Tumidithrix elongata RA019]
MHQKIDAVLTSEQRAKVLQARQSGQNLKDMMKSIQLTALQKQKIRAIQQNSYQQINAILTAEQRAKLGQMRPQR